MLFRKRKNLEGVGSVEKLLLEIDNNLAIAQSNMDAINDALENDDKKWFLRLEPENSGEYRRAHHVKEAMCA